MKRSLVTVSRFLSLVLRHRPEAIGVELDAEGWASVEELLAGAGEAGRSITRAQLLEVVETNDKKRFQLSADGSRIRASQGHSVDVDLGLTPVEPPEILFHGTVDSSLASIRSRGLTSGRRHHVHLSEDRETAVQVGSRRGRPCVLVIEALALHASGHVFYRSENGVWLTSHVPPERIGFPDSSDPG